MKVEKGRVTVHSVKIALCLAFLILVSGAMEAEAEWPRIVLSRDGTPISYEVSGAGDPALVFVHGWSCDARYWREQVPDFSKGHRVVVLDLAGHGHSGTSRTRYTMRAFGEDVRAVTEESCEGKVILIGHSMGGSVIAEAARLMPDRVIGLIGVDTLENIEYPLTPQELEEMLAPFKEDFKEGSRHFVDGMIRPDTDTHLRDWILADMSSAPPAVAVSAMKEMMSQYITSEASKIFEQVRIPVITVNGDMWPIDYEANWRHMFYYDAIVLKDADHFLMMDRPEEFNAALAKAIEMLVRKQAE